MRLAICFLAASLLLATASVAADPFTVRYVPIGQSGSAQVLAADSAGNFFVVAVTKDPSGPYRMRAIKTDSKGNVLASIAFGSSSSVSPDAPTGTAVDPQGNLIVAGFTDADDFPVTTSLVSRTTSDSGFIVKLDSQLTKVLFSTRLGGYQGRGPSGSVTSANAVALDSSGNIYVTGSTTATDFPITDGAYQSSPPDDDNFGGAVYGFVTKIAPEGDRILYSTYFGSSTADCTGGSSCIGVYGRTDPLRIAVDATGAAVIAGDTTANNLPVTPGALEQRCRCLNTVQAGFVAKFSPNGANLKWATYVTLSQLGPAYVSDIEIMALALDRDGNVIIGGSAPAGFPVTSGAVQTAYAGGIQLVSPGNAGFVAKLDAAGQKYVFATYLGGNASLLEDTNGVTALGVDGQGAIWVTGASLPAELPAPNPIPALGSNYVLALSSDGSSVLSAFTAPSGAAAQDIALTQNSIGVLGESGSLLLTLPDTPDSLVGVANAAAVRVSGQVAPYELVSFYGIGIGPEDSATGQIVDGALTQSLGGVQVLFDGTPAPLLYAGPNQINALVPSNVSGKTTTSVQITSPTGTVALPALAVIPSAPQVFLSSAANRTAIAINEDGSLNSQSNPASRGSVVTVWATGAGMPGNAAPDGTVVNPDALSAPVLPVSVLNRTSQGSSTRNTLDLLYAGDAPGLVKGVIQINFRLPSPNLQATTPVQCQLQVGPALSDAFTIYVKQ